MGSKLARDAGAGWGIFCGEDSAAKAAMGRGGNLSNGLNSRDNGGLWPGHRDMMRLSRTNSVLLGGAEAQHPGPTERYSLTMTF